MNNFIYNTPTKVYFGDGNEKKIGEILAGYKIRKVLLHYGSGSIKKTGLYDTVVSSLLASKIDFVELGGVTPNPKLSLVLKGVEVAKKEKVDLILAVGGGSVIDSAKAIAVGAKVDFSPWKFSIKEEIPKEHLPVGVILTIAASGSDMSDSCVITNDSTWEKRGFNNDVNRPLFAILNPRLTFTVSAYQTACGTTDILMHTLERYFSVGADSPLTDNIALGLMSAVIDAGRVVKNDPANYDARATLLWANSLSHNGLTACGRSFVMSVHQLEHELSGMYDNISHGAGLAVLWPQWAKKVYKNALERFLPFAYKVMHVTPSKDPEADCLEALNKMADFFKEIGMPSTLKELGVKEEDLERLADNYTFHGKRELMDIIKIDYNMALEIYKAAY